ncbi:hypothetical protein [Prevotella sp. HUN102]|uniref:hypothetical protein n=1 Tax=Prevotella sp. HUN102 TaxID=1392486 RepID=UPI00048FF4A3|nr:hypothetical protein [Prevotella sp. HUN102]
MDNIDKALDYIASVEKLGAQLKRADEQQRLFLARMLELSRANEEASVEYKELERQSQTLQEMINKWRPIYEQRLNVLKEVRQSRKLN